MEQLFQWISVLDKDTCSQCRQRAGKLYTKAELEKIGYHPLHSIKNGHYSDCRCHLESGFRRLDLTNRNKVENKLWN